MRNPFRWVAALVVGLGMALSSAGVRADEEKVPLAKVPKPALDAVKARFPGSTLREAVKEVDEGKTFFAIGITHDAHSIDVVTLPDGTIVAVEKTLPPAEVPAVVSKAIKAKYPKAELKSAEEIEEDGMIYYEIVIDRVPGKEAGVVVDKAGKILREEG